MKQRLPLILAVAMGALALIESAQAIIRPTLRASDADWQAAADEVRRGFRPGDLIVFKPDWIDQIGRMHLGDLITVEMAGRADDDRYARVWEVTHARGRLQVKMTEKPAAEVIYDFTSHAAEARVTQLPGDKPCLVDAGGFRCATTRVEPRTLEIDYRPRRGILTPVDGDRTTRVEFPDVTLGTQLVGYTGLHDYFSRKNADGPVTFRVFLDGRPVLVVDHRNKDGWRRFEIPTDPGRHTLRFEIYALNPAWRTFGFHAEARK